MSIVNVWEAGVGLAAAPQLLAVLPHTPPRLPSREPRLEFDRSEHPFRQAVLKPPLEHTDGSVKIADGPGPEIEVDRAAVERFAISSPTGA